MVMLANAGVVVKKGVAVKKSDSSVIKRADRRRIVGIFWVLTEAECAPVYLTKKPEKRGAFIPE